MKIKPKDKMFVEGYEGERNDIWKNSTIISNNSNFYFIDDFN